MARSLTLWVQILSTKDRYYQSKKVNKPIKSDTT
jgi:hypothetical protein